MRFNKLPDWLAWQEKLHFTEVDPGLDRIRQVWQNLHTEQSLPFKIVTVAGTNGKGSSVAMLDSILTAAGYKTGRYTSPHLLSYNERICIGTEPCDDEAICLAFEQIDQARAGISLTYFEFATLAAILIFCQQDIDVALLEVGMGGRLDAVNLFDADIALITPISLDHTAWLGDSIDVIALEKAGVMRSGKPVVCSESSPPKTLCEYATNLNAPVYKAGDAFKVEIAEGGWHWQNQQYQFQNLPFPALKGNYQIQNAAAVLQVISLLVTAGFVIPRDAIEQGLETVKLAGRFQVISGDYDHIFDVTHNEQGAKNLSSMLEETPCQGRTFAVLAMLKDKDPQAVVGLLQDKVDKWFLAGLGGNRGLAVGQLADVIKTEANQSNMDCYETVDDAYQHAVTEIKTGDRLLVFGSFHTVEAVMRLM